MTNDTTILLTCTSCHVNCGEVISHIPPQWFFSWVTMLATLTTIQDPPCNANGLIILQQWISAGINMSCSVQDVIWCKWVEMHGQKRAEKGWSRETLGKGHFYPDFSRPQRKTHKHTHFHQKPCSFLMPKSLACLGFGGRNHDGSSSWLRALDLNVGAFYYWKRTIKNNISKKNQKHIKSFTEIQHKMKYHLFVFSPNINISFLYDILEKNINTKWQLQAWSINTQCNSIQSHPWKTIACPAPLKKQNSVKHGDRKLMRAFSPKWCAVNSYSKKATHAETACHH